MFRRSVRRIVERTTANVTTELSPVCDQATVLQSQKIVRSIPVSKHVTGYAVDLVRATRPSEAGVPEFIQEQVAWGAGPRAGQNLILAAKARALLHGRPYVATEDVRAVALPVLRHRVMTNYHAEAEGVTPDEIVTRLLQLVPKDGEK